LIGYLLLRKGRPTGRPLFVVHGFLWAANLCTSGDERPLAPNAAAPVTSLLAHQRSNASSDGGLLMGAWRTRFAHPEFFAL